MPAFEKHVIACPVSTRAEEVPIVPQEPEIQLAFFHPGFSWAPHPPECPHKPQPIAEGVNAGGEDGEALNFEKRAPFPTINLLRARTVRTYANEVTLELSYSVVCCSSFDYVLGFPFRM